MNRESSERQYEEVAKRQAENADHRLIRIAEIARKRQAKIFEGRPVILKFPDPEPPRAA